MKKAITRKPIRALAALLALLMLLCALPLTASAADTSQLSLYASQYGSPDHVTLEVNAIFQFNYPGTFIIKCNGERILENQTIQEVNAYDWSPSVSGEYTFVAEYIPAGPDDPYAFAPSAPQTVTITVASKRDVTVVNGRGSGTYEVGKTVSAVADAAPKDNYTFKEWKVTAGDIGDADLTSSSLTFTMPDEDVTVEATYAFSMQLFFQNLMNKVIPIFQKIIEFFQGIFGGIGA